MLSGELCCRDNFKVRRNFSCQVQRHSPNKRYSIFVLIIRWILMVIFVDITVRTKERNNNNKKTALRLLILEVWDCGPFWEFLSGGYRAAY